MNGAALSLSAQSTAQPAENSPTDSTKIMIENVVSRVIAPVMSFDQGSLTINTDGAEYFVKLGFNADSVKLLDLRDASVVPVSIRYRDGTDAVVFVLNISPAFIRKDVANEAMLAGILGHEIGHILLNHLSSTSSTNELSMEKEAAADSLAVILMSGAGYSVSEFGKWLKSEAKSAKEAYTSSPLPDRQHAFVHMIDMEYRLEVFARTRKAAAPGANAKFIGMDEKKFSRFKSDFGHVR